MLAPRVLFYKDMASPIGGLRIIASERGLRALLFQQGKALRIDGTLEHAPENKLLVRCEKQLGEYFAGKRKAFDLPLDLQGSVFQIKTWRELLNIPYGKTISYGDQARRLGDAKKARAVGMANGRNPLAIIIPCHRVIGSTGALTGFGGGLATKEALLKLEKGFA